MRGYSACWQFGVPSSFRQLLKQPQGIQRGIPNLALQEDTAWALLAVHSPFPGHPFPSHSYLFFLFLVHSHPKAKTTGEIQQRCCCSQPLVFCWVDEIFFLWAKCLKKQSEVEEEVQIGSPWLTGLLCRLFQELCDLRVWLPLALPLNQEDAFLRSFCPTFIISASDLF